MPRGALGNGGCLEATVMVVIRESAEYCCHSLTQGTKEDKEMSAGKMEWQFSLKLSA